MEEGYEVQQGVDGYENMIFCERNNIWTLPNIVHYSIGFIGSIVIQVLTNF